VTAEDVRARLGAARDRHLRRGRPVRILAVLGGGFVAVVGCVLLVPAPELGLPLLLVGLRVLALQYEWAARAYVPVARLWERLKKLSMRWKIAIAAVAVLAVGAIVWWLV
jgi:broad specificity phosphatase PhoE